MSHKYNQTTGNQPLMNKKQPIPSWCLDSGINTIWYLLVLDILNFLIRLLYISRAPPTNFRFFLDNI